jgi:hypothetical protein
MKRVSYRAGVLFAAVVGVTSVLSAGFQAPQAPSFNRYQGILQRMPFGPPPPDPGTVVAVEDTRNAAQELKEQQLLARQINMSCVNITPSGKPAVGFTDLSSKPPVNYYILVGGDAGGWTLKSASYAEEWAELEKDGTTIFVKLGQGLMAEPPVKKPIVNLSNTKISNDSKTAENNFDEQEAPQENLRAALVKRPSRGGRPVVNTLQLQEKLVAQLELQTKIKEIKEKGEDPTSYMTRYMEKLAREKEAKEEAEEEARHQLVNMVEKVSAEEFARRERELNMKLILQGAKPISDIELTEHEEAILAEEGIIAP